MQIYCVQLYVQNDVFVAIVSITAGQSSLLLSGLKYIKTAGLVQ